MSVVRLECDVWRLNDVDKVTLSSIWPVLKTDSKYPTLDPIIIDIDDVHEDIAKIDAIKIKPIQKITFATKAPDFNKTDVNTIREFVKTVNQLVLPGYELLNYNMIKVQTNECTEQIQLDLNEGWRIIAVLPQPGNRRPDYILVNKR